MDVYQKDAALLEEGIKSRGHRPGGHGLPRLEDLVLTGIAEVGYDQLYRPPLADIQKLQKIYQILIRGSGLDYDYLII